MPSKVMEEYLKKASPEQQAELKDISKTMQQSNVALSEEKTSPKPPSSVQDYLKNATPDQKSQLNDISKTLQQNKAVMNEPKGYDMPTPARNGESRPYAGAPQVDAVKSAETIQPTPKKAENAVDRAQAIPTTQTSPTTSQQSKTPER